MDLWPMHAWRANEAKLGICIVFPLATAAVINICLLQAFLSKCGGLVPIKARIPD